MHRWRFKQGSSPLPSELLHMRKSWISMVQVMIQMWGVDAKFVLCTHSMNQSQHPPVHVEYFGPLFHQMHVVFRVHQRKIWSTYWPSSCGLWCSPPSWIPLPLTWSLLRCEYPRQSSKCEEQFQGVCDSERCQWWYHEYPLVGTASPFTTLPYTYGRGGCSCYGMEHDNYLAEYPWHQDNLIIHL